MNILLSPLSFLYGCVTELRNACFDQGVFRTYQSSLPVVSIGNVSVGGNAKTPLVIFLAQELARRNIDAVILSRGYGGKVSGPTRVLETHTAADVGDEPLLISAKTGRPVVIAKNRVQGAKYIEREKLGTVILLDDGFQHRWLARDLDIVTAYVGSEEARKNFIEGKLLPVGRFRENRDHALRRAAVMIFSERQPISDSSDLDPKLFRLIPGGVQLYRSFFEVQGVFSLTDAARLQSRQVVAFCGIANPDGFIETLSRAGFTVLESYRFRDHYNFGKADIQRLRDKHPNVPLVCTEKDARRVAAQDREGLYELRIATKVTPGDAFVTQVCRAILQREKRKSGAIIDLPNSSEARKSTK